MSDLLKGSRLGIDETSDKSIIKCLVVYTQTMFSAVPASEKHNTSHDNISNTLHTVMLMLNQHVSQHCCQDEIPA